MCAFIPFLRASDHAISSLIIKEILTRHSNKLHYIYPKIETYLYSLHLLVTSCLKQTNSGLIQLFFFLPFSIGIINSQANFIDNRYYNWVMTRDVIFRRRKKSMRCNRVTSDWLCIKLCLRYLTSYIKKNDDIWSVMTPNNFALSCNVFRFTNNYFSGQDYNFGRFL